MKSILAAMLLGIALFATTQTQAEDTRLYELRVYHAAPGKLEALNSRFRDHTVKLFEKHGIQNIGYWVPVNNPGNLLIYVISFPNREAREASWKAFGNDPDWKTAKAKSEMDGKLVDQVDSTFLVATDYSPAIRVAAESPTRLFELRTYTTNEGKLSNLDTRFRDHTLNLFEKQGMQNLAYWHLSAGQPGAENTLVYILGFKNQEERSRAWKGFSDDPDWKAAYAASTVNGKLVSKVDSIPMIPTDYSPTK